MKEKFYNFINFLSCELHFFEYLFYLICLSILFYLFEYYGFSVKVLEFFVYAFVGCSFMNTWEIKSKKYKKNKCDDK